MIEDLSESQVNDILSSKSFLEKYSLYEKEVNINKLRNFFDDIETNKNYFRLNVKKSRKYINRNNDTDIIKTINANINKCTDMNCDEITKLIINDINQNEHLLNFVIESILEKCIIQTTFVHNYVKILNEINNNKNILRIMNNTLNKYYSFIFENSDIKSNNVYDNLCNENKRTDNMIGYLMLITYLDKEKIICNRIDKLITNIMNDILEKENDEIYKLLNCLFNIGLISTEYIIKYKNDLIKFKDKKYNSKLRCKVMDIEDLYN
tara:strand:- start:608 stop:1402 length:795 start_codon:yes stop_codon:yes gene_type:complete